MAREFPGGIVVRIPGFHCHGPGSISGWGTKVLQATQLMAQPNKKRGGGGGSHHMFKSLCIIHKLLEQIQEMLSHTDEN